MYQMFIRIFPALSYIQLFILQELTAEEIYEIDAAGEFGAAIEKSRDALSMFAEEVTPKAIGTSRAKALSLILLVAVSLTVAMAFWVGPQIFDCM